MNSKLSFKEFDKKARAGQRLNVVFLGGSLTWGANCSNPNKTSYRALMGEYLQKRYPKSHIKLHDAAIGGTGSDLGLFRLKRDVLSHKPDLVFIDYTVNDGASSDSEDLGETYEAIVRTLIEKKIAVQLTLLGVRVSYETSSSLNNSKRRKQHLKIAKHYSTAVGDTYPYIRKLVKSSKIDLNEVYCFEDTHPDDAGYRLFFEAAREGFEKAVKEKNICKLPEKTLFSGKYLKATRLELSTTQLPSGWQVDKTYRVALWFDGLSSRWMDDVVSCDTKDMAKIKPLTFEFKGSLVGIFGEANSKGLNFKVIIDGKTIKTPEGKSIWDFSTKRFGFNNGNLFCWQLITTELSDTKHTMQIIPCISAKTKEGKLKINSICFAGK